MRDKLLKFMVAGTVAKWRPNEFVAVTPGVAKASIPYRQNTNGGCDAKTLMGSFSAPHDLLSGFAALRG